MNLSTGILVLEALFLLFVVAKYLSHTTTLEFVVPAVSVDRARRTVGSIRYFHPGAVVHLVRCENAYDPSPADSERRALNFNEWGNIESETIVPNAASDARCGLEELRHAAVTRVPLKAPDARVWYVEDSIELQGTLFNLDWQGRTYFFVNSQQPSLQQGSDSCDPNIRVFGFVAGTGAHDFLRSVAEQCAGMSPGSQVRYCASMFANDDSDIGGQVKLRCHARGDLPVQALPLKLVRALDSEKPESIYQMVSDVDMCGYSEDGYAYTKCRSDLDASTTHNLRRFMTFNNQSCSQQRRVAEPAIDQHDFHAQRYCEFQRATEQAASGMWRSEAQVVSRCSGNATIPTNESKKAPTRIAVIVPSTTKGSFLWNPDDVAMLPLFESLL